MPIPSLPPVLPMPIANGGDTRDIPDQTPAGTNQLSFQSGFPSITSSPLAAGGIPPQREDFNAALLLLSQHSFFQQSGGVYPWQGANGDFAGLNYLAGWHALGSNGVEYTAIKASGPDVSGIGPKDPITNPDYWAASFIGAVKARYAAAGTYSFVVPGDASTNLNALIILFGAGGGGASSAYQDRSCGSGGSGEIVIWNTTLTGGQIIPITVGKGGVVGVDTVAPDGGITSFGSLMSAMGGKGGGPRQYYGGVSIGAQVGTELRIPGIPGQPGTQNTNVAGRSAMGGAGGGFGGGRSQAGQGAISERPIMGFGAGGCGGSVSFDGTTVWNTSGTLGADGGVYIFY